VRYRRLAALLCIASCSPAPRPTVTRVELRLVPASGRAWVSFDSRGVARGGHLSGGASPTVHIDTATISADSTRAMFAAVEAIGDPLFARRGPAADSARPGTATLVISFSDSTQSQFVWTAASQPDDERVRVVLDHVVANRIGGW